MALSVNLYQQWTITQELSLEPDDIYDFVIWYRRIVMAISSSLLLINIIMILRSKQYIYNTLKLFMFLQIFTVLGQIIVIIHNQQWYQDGQKHFSYSNQSINNIINTMLEKNSLSMIPCALQAYINLFCYNISYLFALLITLYVRRVIDNTHKYFMKKHYKIILYFTILTFIVYLPPFVLAFLENVPYSFGPVGFQIKNQIFSGDVQQYLFYCGIISRNQSNQFLGQFLSVFNMMIIPIFMFIIHLILLYKNRKSMKFLKGLAQLNPRQWFILQSGTLSVFIFFFQSINFMKYALSLIDSTSSVLLCVVGGLNMIFDLLPIVLVWIYYKKYYRRGKKLQQNSLVRTINDQSIVTNQILVY